jgi:hypothetical protein
VRTTTLAALGLLIFVAPVYSQSLGDVAKKEKTRRKGVEKPATVIDDEALSNGGLQTPITESTVTAAPDKANSTPAAPSSREARPPSTGNVETVDRAAHEATVCRIELDGLTTKKRIAEKTLGEGFSVRSKHRRVKRRVHDSDRHELGWQYVYTQVTCADAARDARHQDVNTKCKQLEREIADLGRQIASKTEACEAKERAARSK